MAKNTKMRWYVVHTMTNSEKRAAALLEKSIELESLSRPELSSMFGKIMVPENISIRDNGKERKVVKFPGYIFVECVLDEVTKTIIRETNRISRINEAPLTPKEVSQMLGEKKEDVVVEIELSIVEGDEVDIIDGPFKSMTAKIVEIDRKNKKVKVGVKMFGRTNSVDLDFRQVQKAQNKEDKQ